ncbi:MAG: mdtK [Candidatus Angelobacter sp.]|jgi:MATE family multidrug resistance protein|nr:mdtK [Candidatus Angelobacter sp.]
MAQLTNLGQEFRPMLRLAGPLVLAELGWMSMGVVDTIMVGHLPNSAEAIGAVSLGGVLFYMIALFGAGVLLGLDTLVSQSFGAGDVEDCHHSLINSIYLVLIMTPVLMATVWIAIPLLPRFGVNPAVLDLTAPFLKAVLWSTFPLLLYFGLRRYLQGMNIVKPIMFVLITANLVNLAGNWILIYGHLGFQTMGVAGSGWATCISRIYMAVALCAYLLYYDWKHKTNLRKINFGFDVDRIRELIRLGFPAAAQMTIEIGIFTLATVVIGRLQPAALAAHQIALNVASVTYMVPLGISSAAAVRVGQAIGRRDADAAARAGWAALMIGMGFMSCAALAFVLFPQYIVRIYSFDPAVMKIGVTLLAVAAVFQIFDGMQIVASGALRGAGETKIPMLTYGVAYWVIGLPLGYYLCFDRGWGATGVWAGLCFGLVLIGSVLLLVWKRKVTQLQQQMAGSRVAAVS